MAKKRGKDMHKKGAEMTIGTIIVIILALVVLVVLIYGFSTGWGNLWNKLTGYGGGTVNVQTVVDGCRIACATGGSYDYCTKKQKVIFDTNVSSARNKQEYSCLALELQQVGLPSCDNVDCGSITKGCDAWGGLLRASGSCLSNYGELRLDVPSYTSQNLVCCVPKRSCEEWKGLWTTGPTTEVQCDSSKYLSQEIVGIILTLESKNSKLDRMCCILK